MHVVALGCVRGGGGAVPEKLLLNRRPEPHRGTQPVQPHLLAVRRQVQQPQRHLFSGREVQARP